MASTLAPGTYADYPALAEALPPLVRKQRRLEAQIVPLAQLLEDEKTLRKQIDDLLVAAGLQKSESVTCLGYDVTHCGRDGQSKLNPEMIIAKLVTAGVDHDLVVQVLTDSTETGDPAVWATVKPSKGAKVRIPPR